MTVVAADGQDVGRASHGRWSSASEPAEVYDIIVEPKDDRAYTIFAQSMDRTGYARGTLAPAVGMDGRHPTAGSPGRC